MQLKKNERKVWNQVLHRAEDCEHFIDVPFFWKGDKVYFRICELKMDKLHKEDSPFNILFKSNCKGICDKFILTNRDSNGATK